MTFNPEKASVTIINEDVVVPVIEQVPFKDSLTPEELPIGATEGPINYPETTILPNGRSVSAFAQSLGIELSSVNSGHPLVTPLDETQIQMAMLASAEGFACPIGQACQSFAVGTLGKTLEPAQTRYAYVWGDKTPSTRTGPDPASASICQDLLYGLDCSGLVTDISNAASITAPAGSSAQSDPDNWNNLPANVSLIAIGDGSIQAGDLVFWSGHDGIATDSADFISSTGSKGMSCAANIKRGPVEYSFTAFGKGLPTKVLRFVSDTRVKLTADPTSLPSTGGTVTLTATVTALVSGSGTSPTGTVSFTDQNGVTLCSAVNLASGSAVCPASISAAPDKVTATYSGDPNDAASKESRTVTAGVNPWVGGWDGNITSTCGYISGPFDIVIVSAGGNQLNLTDNYGDAYSLTISSSNPDQATSISPAGINYTISRNSMTVSAAASCQTGSLTRQ
jgi:hypothetical protein